MMLLRSKPLRSTVNGPPFFDKINRRERALSRGSLRSREKREEPVTGEMRRNAGQDRAGTQGWQGSCQVAMPASRGSFCWFNVVFSSDQRVLVLKRTAALSENGEPITANLVL
ncbi:hypothetical protein DS67_02925 [Mesotoga sp. SC_4PWA21]|nr:hypothetical protein DS67_02925 [Mesotoga sp. SC_4PWA21]